MLTRGDTPSGDHLRVCGADVRADSGRLERNGSSPRVRSRRGKLFDRWYQHGIISACAEQTRCPCLLLPKMRDHLRVCGADHNPRLPMFCTSGSSPRVRSRQAAVGSHARLLGIISACAEQTSLDRPAAAATWDHLRVCGADHLFRAGRRQLPGSSPRVRSRRAALESIFISPRIISACAEQTRRTSVAVESARDHLRVCGADVQT